MGGCNSRRFKDIYQGIFANKNTEHQELAQQEKIIANLGDFKIKSMKFVDKKEEVFRDNYIIGQCLGRSEYAQVRKCRNKASEIVRAVKIFKKSKMTAKMVRAYHNDLEMLQKLNHPNILELNEFYEDKYRYYMVTELCTGDELFDSIEMKIQQQETFNEREAAQIIT